MNSLFLFRQANVALTLPVKPVERQDDIKSDSKKFKSEITSINSVLKSLKSELQKSGERLSTEENNTNSEGIEEKIDVGEEKIMAEESNSSAIELKNEKMQKEITEARDAKNEGEVYVVCWIVSKF